MNSQSGTPPPRRSPAPPELLLGHWTVGDPVVMPKAALRQIATYGHLVERFVLAQQVFLKRASKPGVFDEIKPWLHGLSAEFVHPLEGEGVFLSTLAWEKGRLTSHGLLSDPSTASCFLELWKKLDAEAAPPTPLATSPLSNASLWPALLRLKPLREFWERELGRSHWEALCDILPDAWLVAPDVLPPGAVIPRLEISNWSEFSQIGAPERSFTLTEPSASNFEQEYATQENITAALTTSSPPKVLSELPPRLAPLLLAAIYERKGKRTELLGSFAFREPVSVHALISG